jgi:hypothetical protein
MDPFLFSNGSASGSGSAAHVPAPVAEMVIPQPWSFLFRLPPEILYMICRETLYDGTNTLTSLARTCRTLNRVAILVLYAEIADRPRRADDVGPSREYNQVLRLHRTLFTTPSLAGLVRSLTFEHNRLITLSSGHFQWFPTYSTALQQRFGLDTQQPELREPVHTLMMCAVCPNLAELGIAATRRWGNTDFLLRRHNGRVTGPRFTFNHLKELTIWYMPLHRTERLGHGLDLHRFNGLFHAVPNLETLTISRARSGTSLTCRLTRLTTLTLTDCHLCTRGLRHLLRGCNRLVSFTLQHDPDSSVIRFPPISPASILECLAPFKQTLQRLHITPWIPSPNHVYVLAGTYHPHLTHLAEFTALRHVGLDYSVITANDRRALVRLLQGLGDLETVFLSGLKGSELAFYDQFSEFSASAAHGMEWPRLRLVKLQAKDDEDQVVAQRAFAELVDGVNDGGSMSGVRVLADAGVVVQCVGGWVDAGPFAED